MKKTGLVLAGVVLGCIGAAALYKEKERVPEMVHKTQAAVNEFCLEHQEEIEDFKTEFQKAKENIAKLYTQSFPQ